MYYIYDYEGYYKCKTDSWFWAKKMADYYEGWIKIDGMIIYDYWEWDDWGENCYGDFEW